MTNLNDIQEQIEKLQKQADEIRAKQFDTEVHEILQKMQEFGITLRDLRIASVAHPVRKTGNPTRARKDMTDRGSRPPVAAKYRGPHGEEWSGRGLTPRWMSALIEAGQSKESFAINA